MKLSTTFKQTPSIDFSRLRKAQDIKEKAESKVSWAKRIDGDTFDEDPAPDSVKETQLRGGRWETARFQELPDGTQRFDYQETFLSGLTYSRSVEHRLDGTSVYSLGTKDPWHIENGRGKPSSLTQATSAIFETSTGALRPERRSVS